MTKRVVTGACWVTLLTFSMIESASAITLAYNSNISGTHTHDYQAFSHEAAPELEKYTASFSTDFSTGTSLFYNDADNESSVSSLNASVIDVIVDAGYYIAAVSSYHSTLADAISVSNIIEFTGDGAYTHTVSIDKSTLTPESIPTTTTMLIFGTGVMTFAANRFRKNKSLITP